MLLMQGKTHGYYHNYIWNISSAQGLKINSIELKYMTDMHVILILL